MFCRSTFRSGTPRSTPGDCRFASRADIATGHGAMASKASAAPNVDPLLRDTPSNKPAVTEENPRALDEAVIAPLSELLAYVPLNRGRSSTFQTRVAADDQEDRMPLFLERDDSAADDGFHFKQHEPEHRVESRQDSNAAYPSSDMFDPDLQQGSIDSFIKPGFSWYAAWAGVAAFLVVGIFGGLVFFLAAPSAVRSSKPRA